MRHNDAATKCSLMRKRFANMDALREIYKKLVPGGILGLIWNVEDCESVS